MSERVVITLDVDSKGAVTGVRNAEGALVKLDRQADKASAGGLGKLKGALAGLVTVAALRQLAQYAGRIYDLATAAEETASKFGTVFGPAAQALDARLKELANRAGLTQTEIRGLAATGGAVAQGLGMGKQASADYSLSMIALAADVASFSNVQGGTEAVMRAFTSAVTGEREALKSLGIVISEEQVKQKQAERASEGHADALTEQGKAAATLELITEKAGDAVGDLERTQDSAANSGRALAAVAREEEERFARLNQVAVGLVQQGLAQLLAKNRDTGRSFAEVLAGGILTAISVGMQFGRAAGQVAKALLSLGGTVFSLVSGGGSPFEAFTRALGRDINQVNKFAESVLIANRVLMVAQRMRERMELALNRLVLKNPFLSDAQHQEALENVVQSNNAVEDYTASIKENRLALVELRRERYDRNASDSGLGSSFDGAAARFRELRDNVDALDFSLPDGADIRAAGDGLASAVGEVGKTIADEAEDAEARRAEAVKKAREEAEQDRRDAIDKAFADRAERVAAMTAENLEKELAGITLAFDEKREAYRREYGALTADEVAMFEASQEAVALAARVNDGRRRGQFGADVTATAGGNAIDRGDQAELRREMEERHALREQEAADIRAMNESLQGDAARTRAAAFAAVRDFESQSQSIARVALDLFTRVTGGLESLTGRHGVAVANVIDQLAGVFQQAAADGGKYFEVYKGFAVAQAGIATYESAVKAYNSLAGIPFVGPALGAAAAAAATVAGIANVNRIRSMQPGGGAGGSSSGGYASASSGAALSAGLSLAPQSLGGAPQPPQPINVAAPNVTVPRDERPIIVQVNGRPVAVANRKGEAELDARFGGGGGL